MDRLSLYLHDGAIPYYNNTAEEEQRLEQFDVLYQRAKAAQISDKELSATTLDKYRRAYRGELGALDKDGKESTSRPLKHLRKIVYEFVESKIDNSIPMPKMVARHRTDKYLIEVTEAFMKDNLDNLMAKYVNDAAERSTYIDGTSWFKVCWDPEDSTHNIPGHVRIETLLVDQVIPQPGIKDYKQLEYVFERSTVSLSKIYDLYGRYIMPVADDSNMVEVISCYYLNDDHIVGLFMWAEATRQVICDEKDWQIRKIRYCTTCGAVQPTQTVCDNCGHKTFKYCNAETEILSEDLIETHNPYEAGETDNPDAPNVTTVFATAGTEIPFYRLRQLPFVPRPAVSRMDSIYGMSEVKMILEEQDATNKLLTKGLDKGLKSGTVITKPDKTRIGDMDQTIKVVGVRTTEEAQMVQAKQLVSDVSQDLVLANLYYESARSASGVTESFQGKSDSSAVSGKAKMYAAAQSAGRIQSLREMKAAAFAGVYELVLKYLLAFTNEPIQFTRVLPNGDVSEVEWNKYMFLAKGPYGEYYYRDDFQFNTDAASTLSQDRASMWQETDNKFIQGMFGNPADPRNIELYWNIMSSFDYPLARLALAGIKANSQHLPPEIEQSLMQNPELLQQLMTMQAGGTDQRGGARPNSGPDGNGATHAANVERTNERNRAVNEQTVGSAQTGGPKI